MPGAGYLPVGERKLPRRAKGNLNEAIIFKRDVGLSLAGAAWPDPALVPDFRRAVEAYRRDRTGPLELVPVYARALQLPADFFAGAMRDPFWRLRMTRYHPVGDVPSDEFGIAPHVDTTFFTLLAQDSKGSPFALSGAGVGRCAGGGTRSSSTPVNSSNSGRTTGSCR